MSINSIDLNENKLSNSYLIDLLHELRKSKLSRPDIVVNYGPKVINKLSENELWNLIEQILLSSLDLGLPDTAKLYLDRLIRKFPQSVRVGRLSGMYNEAKSEYERALFIYNEYLKENPASILLMKRKVAVHKTLGKLDDAVEELNVLLKLFPFDLSSWIELASIYLTIGDLQSAAHCYEEVILLEPQNHYYHNKLAEIYYSISDSIINNILQYFNIHCSIDEFDYYVLARKHYTISLNITSAKVNLRALYGLITTSKIIEQDQSKDSLIKKELKGSSGVSDGSVNKELLQWAKETLFELSESSSNNHVLKLISTVLN